MKTKQAYTTPEIILVALDSEISLQLNSDPNPLGEPDWAVSSGLSQDPMMDVVF